MEKLRLILISLLILGLVLPGYSALKAISEEREAIVEEEPAAEDVSIQGVPQNKPQKAEYVPGQLIVKLKEGKTLNDIQDLNNKYGVTSVEEIFKKTPDPTEVLRSLQDELAGLNNPSPQSWYWQLDKNSEEYKARLAKLEEDKAQLKAQIKAQKDLITKLEERNKAAPAGLESPDLNNVYLLKTSESSDILAMCKEYLQNPSVEYAHPNHRVKLHGRPTDPDIFEADRLTWKMGACANPGVPRCWWLKSVGMTQVWDNFPYINGRGVVIAVIDTGVDYKHPEIKGQMWVNPLEDINHNGRFDDWPSTEQTNGAYGDLDGEDNDHNGKIDDICGWNFQDNNADYRDEIGHGTFVSGIIAAKPNNGRGFAGVAPGAKIMTLMVRLGSDASIADAIYYAVSKGADIINCSFAVPASDTIKRAFDYAWSKGCIIVASAGNDPIYSRGAYSADLDYVITVAASDPGGRRCQWSTYGNSIDVAAPGGVYWLDPAGGKKKNIFSLVSKDYISVSEEEDFDCMRIDPDGSSYGFSAGTSFSAPIVVGAIALLKQRRPLWSNDDIIKALYLTAKDIECPGWDVASGYGIIDISKALSLASVPKIEAKIDHLQDSGAGDIIINGTAQADDFKEYILEYSRVVPDPLDEETIITNPCRPFIRISRSSSQCIGGTLGHWDTSKIDPGEYIIRLTVVTNAGLRLCATRMIPVRVKDTMAPINCRVKINPLGPNPATSQEVTLALYAEDNHLYSTGVVEMKIRNDEDKDYSLPVPYASEISWRLSPGYGKKMVWTMFRDGAGNWSSPTADSIELIDASPPTTPTVRDSGSTTFSTTEISGQWLSEDPESGIKFYKCYVDTVPGTFYTLASTMFPSSETSGVIRGLNLEVGRTYYINVKAENNCGQFSLVGYSDGITVTTPYSISGHITTPGGVPAYGIVIQAGSQSVSVSASGDYTISGFSAGTQRITPTNTRWRFEPLFRDIAITNSNVSGINFIAERTYFISGTVTQADGGPVAEVIINVNGETSVTTGADGYYIKTGLRYGYDYYLTPSKPGYTFTPSRRHEFMTTNDISNVNFTVLSSPSDGYYISGRVTTSTGTGVSFVTITIGGRGTTTDAGGYYMRTGLVNGTYTTAPSKSSHTFNPSTRTVTVNGGNITEQNFTAIPSTPSRYSISGWIWDTNGVGVVGASVTISGQSAPATTESGGYYQKSVLSGTYQVTPSNASYTFSPTSRSVTVNNSNVTDISFIATGSGGGGGTPTSYTISGYVKNRSGAGVSYIPIVVAGGGVTANASTDNNGHYQIAMPARVTYTVSPSRYSGYTFVPSSQSVYLNDRDISGINFTAQ